MSNLVDKATMLQVITCLNSLLDRANHDEYLTRIGKKEALKFLEENEKYADIIKSSLQRLEAIDNAKPSEAFECSLKLYKMVESAGNDNGFNLNEAWKYHNIIKQALLKAQELEKENEFLSNTIITVNNGYTSLMSNYQEQKQVLKIINEKNVLINGLKHSMTLGLYNKCLDDDMILTQEEFDLLKEVLK